CSHCSRCSSRVLGEVGRRAAERGDVENLRGRRRGVRLACASSERRLVIRDECREGSYTREVGRLGAQSGEDRRGRLEWLGLGWIEDCRIPVLVVRDFSWDRQRLPCILFLSELSVLKRPLMRSSLLTCTDNETIRVPVGGEDCVVERGTAGYTSALCRTQGSDSTRTAKRYIYPSTIKWREIERIRRYRTHQEYGSYLMK
ncbi:hypothetical protein PENTCL1PPCAC_18652, partial [Pristionchus entomophagus]